MCDFRGASSTHWGCAGVVTQYSEDAVISYKKPSGAAQLAVPADAQCDLNQNQRLKIAWLAHTWGIPPTRILNLDETSLRLLPSSDFGWSVRNERAKHLVDGKRQVTCTLAMTMEPSSFGIHAELIYAGKTPRVQPMGPMPALCHIKGAFVPAKAAFVGLSGHYRARSLPGNPAMGNTCPVPRDRSCSHSAPLGGHDLPHQRQKAGDARAAARRG